MTVIYQMVDVMTLLRRYINVLQMWLVYGLLVVMK